MRLLHCQIHGIQMKQLQYASYLILFSKQIQGYESHGNYSF